MNAPQWEPGAVAMAMHESGFECIAVRGGSHWVCADPRGVAHHVDGSDGFTDIRPVVVIDPEDPEAVVRLRKALNNSGAFTSLTKGNFAKLQAALREFANPTPPKPAEPTGLGAVVEDSEGAIWVRTGSSETLPWKKANFKPNAWTCYRHIPAVSVLSEGWSA